MAPPLLAPRRPGAAFTSEPALADAVQKAVAGYWQGGVREFPPALAGLVDYWTRYHLVKSVTAALLLIVLVALAVRAGRRPVVASLAAVPALFAVALVMANVQGVVAPFASLLPLVAGAGSLEPARQDLAGSLASGSPAAPAVEVMVADFALYHVAMVAIAAVVATALAAVSWWIRRRSADLPGRRWWFVTSAAMSLLVAVVAVANASTAADPAPALLAFLNGGW
ncbi:hypothetical protein Q0Z83_020120 [Actinoplanes sichuanensis]|uniref:Uncharacterized protein n=1 Tax=Actinoplanes sichuanensis TaxID=512349 RepID=A0ABW4AKA2_9ACTN|nr:hypothetical protein [Actinoplanes sichuanensis]BEL03821.1 hypothetical protein Q0Z83_020120 [Actinoplanes sichuanensis]